MGPHASVEIQIDGLEGRRCYATLLSKQESTGPASAWDGYSAPQAYMLEGLDREEASRAFYAFGGYRDPDGYYFLQHVFLVEEGSFRWGYYPPGEFKLLLYFPDTDTLVSGEKLQRYAFDSAYRCALQPDGSLGQFTRTNNPLKQIPSFLLRVAATILLELLAALPFGYFKKRCLPLLIKTNLITQLSLNVLLIFHVHSVGSGASFTLLYVFLELAVLFAETMVYVTGLPARTQEHTAQRRIVCYSVLANAVSFGVGLWLAKLLPFRF